MFLRRFYHVTNIYLPRLKGGVVVQGNGSLSGLVGSDFNSPAVLQTWNPNDPDSLRNDFSVLPGLMPSFVIAGTAQCALAVGGCVSDMIENVENCLNNNIGNFGGGPSINHFKFTGVDGFRFEKTFGHSCKGLWTTGATIQNIHFRIGAAVLATTFKISTRPSLTDYHVCKISGERILGTPFQNGAVPGKLAFIFSRLQVLKNIVVE